MHRSDPASLLTSLDPRLKLLLLPLLVAAAFSADSPWRLLLMSALGMWLFAREFPLAQLWWRIVRPLRFLLLVTLLTHLWFSSGWTLFGQTWLSLDGLRFGLLVCWRLLVAVLYAALLTRTSSPEELAAALGALLAPLRRLGIRIDRLTRFLALTLYLLPLLQREAGDRLAAPSADLRSASLWERLRTLLGRIEPLILDLADRAETLAGRLAAGDPIATTPALGEMRPVPGGRCAALAGLFFLALIFLL